MPPAAGELTIDEIKTLASAHIRISEYDRLIDSQNQAYSNWFVVAAVAGFSLAITHADALHVGGPATKGLFFTVLGVSLLSILAGVFVRHLGNKNHSYARQKMTFGEVQYLNFRLSPPSAPEKDMRDLTSRVLEGHYLEREEREKLKGMEKKIKRLSALQKRVSIAQQILVGAAYLAIGFMSVLEHV